ncbi:flagellar biosynthesis protein FlhF [Thermovibrio sp.]
MSVKVFEGEDLTSLIEKAKKELGEVEILYYEVEKKGLFPFLKKKWYRLFVMEKEEEREREEVRELLKLEKEVEELKELLKEVKSVATSPPSPPVPPYVEERLPCGEVEEFKEFTGDALELIDLLVKKGVEKEVARAVVKEACGLDIESEKLDLNTATFREALLKGISSTVSFTGEFKVERGQKKAFVFLGPTGVGKTTNLFKIASKFVIERELKVGVITTDTFKVGGTAQARTYASILNVPFFVATDHKKLKEIVNGLKELDVILVDTVGRSHYDYWRLGEVKAVLQGLEVPTEMLLLLSCNYSFKEALEVVNRYRSFFPITSLFFTKIDETSRPGLLLSVPYYAGFPVSYISTGQRVPEDIRLLTPEVITNYLLGER